MTSMAIVFSDRLFSAGLSCSWFSLENKSGAVRERRDGRLTVGTSCPQMPCSPGDDVQRRGSGHLGFLTVGRGGVGQL